MCSLPLQLLLAIFLLKNSDGQEITFKNVTIKYTTDSKNELKVATAESLKKIVPSGEKVSVNVNGDVPVLYEQSIYDLQNLKSLEITEVSLKEIKPGAFGNLPLLRNLDLSKNNLTEIKSGTFSNLNLTVINLMFNSIRSLQAGTFKNVVVQELKLSANSLTEFPRGIFENVTLKSLYLNSNPIHTISPKALPISLKDLDLFYAQLESIDPEIFDYPELTSLILDHNQIKFLRPGDLKNLPRLEDLTLSYNKLTEIPEGVFNNTNIMNLKLNYNQISTVATKAFDDMPKLEWLDISKNKLTLWDNNWLPGSPELFLFFVDDNQITEIPDEAFKNYNGVFLLSIENNKISKISMKAFHNLGHIRFLSLASNELESWNPDLVANVNIGEIDVSKNKFNSGKGSG
ncbi:hypothetical protein Zmor_015894 [Zophobas morio]|uniref:Uncharacterized protein n=1 Tax=Zophobas morio TaxID=2755281 RepID=A0AA38IP84_9CUCU|nr:hypothetical protein Zmor_015894 [Zophobas morio]